MKRVIQNLFYACNEFIKFKPNLVSSNHITVHIFGTLLSNSIDNYSHYQTLLLVCATFENQTGVFWNVITLKC